MHFETEIELGDDRRISLEWSLPRCEVRDDEGVVWCAAARCQVWRYVRLLSGSSIRTARLCDPFELEVASTSIELAARALVLGAVAHALKWDS